MNRSKPHLPNRLGLAQQGLTLIESMVVVAIIAILASLTAPSFIETFRRYRVDAAREALSTSINLARAEAIRTGQSIVLRRLTGCGVTLVNTQDWSCGWQFFADLDNDNVLNGTEVVIQRVAGSNQITVRKGNPVNPQFLVIDRFGQVTQLGQRFEIFPADLAAVNGQLLCFTAGTRLRTVRNATACPAGL